MIQRVPGQMTRGALLSILPLPNPLFCIPVYIHYRDREPLKTL